MTSYYTLQNHEFLCVYIYSMYLYVYACMYVCIIKLGHIFWSQLALGRPTDLTGVVWIKSEVSNSFGPLGQRCGVGTVHGPEQAHRLLSVPLYSCPIQDLQVLALGSSGLHHMQRLLWLVWDVSNMQQLLQEVWGACHTQHGLLTSWGGRCMWHNLNQPMWMPDLARRGAQSPLTHDKPNPALSHSIWDATTCGAHSGNWATQMRLVFQTSQSGWYVWHSPGLARVGITGTGSSMRGNMGGLVLCGDSTRGWMMWLHGQLLACRPYLSHPWINWRVQFNHNSHHTCLGLSSEGWLFQTILF